MATINLGTPSPIEGGISHVDLKQPTVQVQPVTLDTPSSTPATTPDQNSPSEEHNMTGNKVFSTQRADDKARKLAATLTLEEQVRTLHNYRKSLNHEREVRSRFLHITYDHSREINFWDL
jgi:beta-glucosidase